MKKLLQLLLMGTVVFSASCKKSNNSNSHEEKYSVTFAVSEFTESIKAMKMGNSPHILAEPLKNHISVLQCRIYDSSGELVLSENQDQSDSNFGTITNLYLWSGNFTAVFIGSKSTIAVNNSEQWNTANFSFAQPVLNDTYYKKVNFTIVNQPIVETIKLDRIIAGLNVVIADAIPDDLAKIEVTILDDQNVYKFSNDARSGKVNRAISFPIATADHGKTNKNLDTYAFRTNSPLTVVIKGYGVSSQILYEKSIPFVTFFPNKVTTLKGKLFNAKTDFEVTINPIWDTPLPVVQF